MGTWLPPVIAGVASVFAAIVAAWSAVKVAKVNAESDEKKHEEDYIKNITDRIELLETASKCLLRGDIIRSYNHYIEKQYIPIYGMENVTEEFDVYEKMHGNGTVPGLVDDLKELPHEPPNQ